MRYSKNHLRLIHGTKDEPRDIQARMEHRRLTEALADEMIKKFSEIDPSQPEKVSEVVQWQAQKLEEISKAVELKYYPEHFQS